MVKPPKHIAKQTATIAPEVSSGQQAACDGSLKDLSRDGAPYWPALDCLRSMGS